MKTNTTSRRRGSARMGAAAFAATMAIGTGVLAGPPSQATTPAASAAATACTTNWGSWAKTAPDYSWSQVLRVRAGRHTCFDRMVVDLRGTLHGYDVRYAQVYTEGQGKRVWLSGGGDLRVIVKGPGYNSGGEPTYNPPRRLNAVDVAGYRTFRQIAFAGSFEGQTTFGVGTRARLPMRAFILRHEGGSKLVVDVATW